METKICTTCKVIKPLSEFCKDKFNKDNLDYECRCCNKMYRAENADNIKKSSKKYHNNNKDKAHEYYLINKERFSEKAKEYYLINKEEILQKTKEYAKENKEKTREWKVAWCSRNKESIGEKREKNKDEINRRRRELYQENNNDRLIAATQYREKNREKIRKWGRDYWNRAKTNPMKRLKVNISSSMCISLNGNKNGYRWEGLVGYTLVDLKNHLESLFQDYMTWDNYGRGGWEIDHIYPVSRFNFISTECDDFKKCWALENLQPLWEKENQRKGNKLNYRYENNSIK